MPSHPSLSLMLGSSLFHHPVGPRGVVFLPQSSVGQLLLLNRGVME